MEDADSFHVKTSKFLLVVLLVAVTCMGATAEEATSPRDALGRLKAGNDRFVQNALLPVSLSTATRASLVKQQTPYAMVLSCADSRVPPEFIFNAGLGDLFVIRAAGEVVDRSIMASLEYGAEHLHIPLLVVLGHESCGAVQAVVDGSPVEGPNLDYMVRAIKAGTGRTPKEQADVRAAILGNVEQSINDALAGSEILRHAVQIGALQVVGGYYELGSGRVLFSEPISSVPSLTPRLPAPDAKPARATRK